MPGRLTYIPGTWTGVSAFSVWGVVLVPVDDARVPDLWSAAADGVDEVLDALARQGLRNLPGFAIVEHDDEGLGLRFVVRGPAVISADGVQVETTTGGPWFEGRLPRGTSEVRLSAPGNIPLHVLPTSSGVTAVSSLVLLFSEKADDLDVANEPVADAELADPPPSVPEPESRPEPVLVNVAEADSRSETVTTAAPEEDQTAAYYQLLVSSTTDLETLRATLADAESTDSLPHPSGEPGAGQPEHIETGLTGVWADEIDAGSDGVESGESSEFGASPAAAPGGVIDGVPWASETPTTPTPTPTPSRSPLAASTPPVPDQAPPVSRDPVPEADPTAVTTSRAALLRQLAEERPVGPRVLAVQCARGHLSPSYAVACRICGAQLPVQDPVQVPRPPLGRLVLSNGSTVPLDRGVVFGRSPESSVDDPAERPNLVRLVESGEISRTHTSVTLDGWQVMVRDLSSRNGTFLALPGAEQEQIRPNQDYVLEPGSVVSLADVVSFTFEIEA